MSLDSSNAVKFSVFNLAQEVIDQIIDFVDAPSDVRALALTCRRFKSILIPHHTHYRSFHLSLLQHDILDSFINRPALARNVRDLRVELVSTDATDSALRLGEEKLALAIKHMRNLVSFYSSYHPSSNKDLVWDSLRTSCPRLSSIRGHDFNLHNSKLFEIRYLEKFNLVFSPLSPPDMTLFRAGADRIIECFLGCPNLSELKVSHGPGNLLGADNLLRLANWAKLTTLHLHGLNLDAAVLSSFLSRHPTIRSLSLSPCRLETLAVECLPQLRRLAIVGNQYLWMSMDDVFRDACWPHLVDLTLKHAKCSEDIFTPFLVRHPTLVDLCLDDFRGLGELVAGTLPRLTDKQGNHEDALIICRTCCPLKTLDGLDADEIIMDPMRVMVDSECVSETLETVDLQRDEYVVKEVTDAIADLGIKWDIEWICK
ncbi:hypothetical protein JAAARDRAFT_207810 [Jaapia argillacea MUCL 33604]|uniref:F-box domain-containing protein n=1 Tax=Jaapia argillacea MUCL 33604 TaxID=933084 RepID=A0A067PPL7_9AGAM|nr:hypothetical protein JAAARDRAFT_207810 [Jaapia argillacea MUCL 33604]